MLNKIEKRMAVAAIVFVIIYLGAAALTLYNRSGPKDTAPPRIESAAPQKAESRIALVELFPPMMVLLTLTIAFWVVKKKRAQQLIALEQSDEDDALPDPETPRADRQTGDQG